MREYYSSMVSNTIIIGIIIIKATRGSKPARFASQISQNAKKRKRTETVETKSLTERQNDGPTRIK